MYGCNEDAGSPDREFDYVHAYATTSFGFVTEFRILAAK